MKISDEVFTRLGFDITNDHLRKYWHDNKVRILVCHLRFVAERTVESAVSRSALSQSARRGERGRAPSLSFSVSVALRFVRN